MVEVTIVFVGLGCIVMTFAREGYTYPVQKQGVLQRCQEQQKNSLFQN